ncbi:MAG: FAD-binding protein [Ferruginibacter sp.]|nr:FAD-binding protein [Ferruginibacter sp.]
MQQKISLKLLPAEAADEQLVKKYLAASAGKKMADISGFRIVKKSIDARGKKVFINLSIDVFINEPVIPPGFTPFEFPDVSNAGRTVIIIGAGPAGLFAAIKLIQAGIRPLILERGKDIRSRRRDLAILNKEGSINPESNYCFGEGGAGTYSDGKLYTRSSKRGDIDRILRLFVQFGAPENILYDAHPHIGTNKLPQIITAMREMILQAGGKIYFEKKVTDLKLENSQITAVTTADGENFTADAYILATGHSARDIFYLLHEKQILIEAKPFALGVRIEHPQSLIDSIQYHQPEREEHLPPASYSLVQQVNGRGVFSFCMCPGGIIAPAATSANELVVNGWSPSKRNNPFANSGMVVQVEKQDAVESLTEAGHDPEMLENDPLLFLKFQQMVEERSFNAGGGNFVAPAQRMQDFINKKVSDTLPENSYLPGLAPADLQTVLPPFIYTTLAEGFRAFGKKLKGYLSNDAVVVATESRTSSPVRIPRDPATLVHPQVSNLYPCGEGAGYAGGIVSAAMDGERIADMIAQTIKR